MCRIHWSSDSGECFLNRFCFYHILDSVEAVQRWSQWSLVRVQMCWLGIRNKKKKKNEILTQFSHQSLSQKNKQKTKQNIDFELQTLYFLNVLDTKANPWELSWAQSSGHRSEHLKRRGLQERRSSQRPFLQTETWMAEAGRWSGVWVCNAIKPVPLPVWSASFHLAGLIWRRNQISRGHHVFSHQTWRMTMFPLCFLFISSLQHLRTVVIRSSPALHTMAHCVEKRP